MDLNFPMAITVQNRQRRDLSRKSLVTFAHFSLLQRVSSNAAAAVIRTSFWEIFGLSILCNVTLIQNYCRKNKQQKMRTKTTEYINYSFYINIYIYKWYATIIKL